jgi:type I restriction enzyme, S subunit
MNADWQWVQLGEISEVISKGTTPTTHGVAFLDSGIPFLRAEDVVGGAVDITSVKYYVSDKTHDTLLARSKLQPGDFLITIAGSLGRVGYVPFNAPPLNCNQAVAFVRLKPNTIDLNFLLYVFQYEGITKSLLDVQKVGTIGNLNLEQIREFKLPLPPLDEQKRIASLLARADRLRGLRRAARALGESLLQGVFLEMFGDPRTNPMGWKVEKVGKHIKNIRYGTGSPPDYYEKGIPFIRATNVKQGTIKSQGLVYISEEAAKNISKCQIRTGDLIVVRSGVNSGDCALIPPEYDGAYAAYDLIVEVPFPTNHFLNTVINSPFGKETIATLSRRAGQPHVNSEQIASMEYPFPPLPLQDEFARVVARVEGLRGRMSESERQVEGLFGSLLHEAFNG